MTAKKAPKWAFSAKFRTRAFGWNGSRLACQRIIEAVSEIRKVTRKDPQLGAEGAIKLMQKLWPALQHVDSSSGALGTAVYNAVEVLVDVVAKAPVRAKTRAKWLDRLWEAFSDDGVGFLDRLGERWGDVCGSGEIASQWADELMPIVKQTWEEARQGSFSYFRGTDACLSALHVAGRYRELLDLMDVRAAFDYALSAAEKLGLEKQVLADVEAIVGQDQSAGKVVKTVLGGHR